VIVQASVDQIVGLCKELEDDYGFEASGVEAQALDDGAVPPELLYADLLVTTKGHESIVCELASRLDKPCIIVDIRPDLIGGDWRLLLNRPVYVVVHDARFVPAMLAFFATVPGADNIRPLVLGVDDLGCIPDDASTYVTRSARQQMKDVVIPGRLLPTTRLIASESARELLRFVVHANLEVLAARGR